MQLDSKDEELRAIAKASKRDKMTKIHIEVCATDFASLIRRCS